MIRNILALTLAASLLAGCSMFNKLTGQRDDTVLPGAREDILPPDQQVNNRSAAEDIAGDAAIPCDSTKDLNCPTSVDQTSKVDQEGSGDGLQ